MASVLIWFVVIVSAINIVLYLFRPGVRDDPDAVRDYEQELRYRERRLKVVFVLVACLFLLGILAIMFFDWL
jgi:hypothetical protein